MSHDSEEFTWISQYVANTHAETHSSYKLVLEDVFKVERHGKTCNSFEYYADSILFKLLRVNFNFRGKATLPHF